MKKSLVSHTLTSPCLSSFFNKNAILLYLSAVMTGEEPQNVDTVLIFHAAS